MIDRTPADARSFRDALAILVDAARAAGEGTLSAFRPGGRTAATVSWKDGGSPVTEADRAADALLAARLRPAFPQAGWLSEETLDDPARLACRQALVVDPIDGTRGFMNGDDRYAVCVALVEAGRPVAAVVHLPARGETFAAALGAGASLNGAPIAVSGAQALSGARVAGPTPFMDALFRQTQARAEGPVLVEPRGPSLAYRLISVACGRLDAAFASARAHDWDLAAADLILHEAGGSLTDLEGIRPIYNRPETRHPELAAAPIALREAVLSAARQARR